MELKDLHEEVFKFLLEKRKSDPTLRYSLRSNDRSDKLSDNYWFLMSGNPQSLYVSFWQAYPFSGYNVLSLPTIRFEIKVDGKCVLYIRETNPNYIPLWNNIADALSLKQTKREDRWEKEYNVNDFKVNLEHFISVERPYLDSFFKLKGVENAYPPIGEVDFLARFDKIQSLREKQADSNFSEFLNQKLLIKGLILKNINAFKDLSLSFEKPVTCFVGGNGSGKTTILRAIALGLVGFNLLKDKPNLLSIKEAHSDTLYEPEGSINVIYSYENKETEYGVSFSSIENGRSARGGENYNPFQPVFYKRLVSKEEIDAMHYRALNELIGKEESLKALIVGFAQQSYAKETNSSNRRRPNISDLNALILNEPENRFEEFVSWFREELKKDDDKNFRILIGKIIDIINNCIRKDQEDKSNDIDFVGITKINLKTKNNPKGIPIEKLSQGYRNLFSWVGFFAKRMHEYHQTLIEDGILSDKINFMDLPAVCLIDEIDTYLHPDWQYSILKGLVESFPNVQFFITSHSPFVLTSVPSDKITIYEIDTEGGTNKDEIVIHEIIENLYGSDIRRATKEISEERLPSVLRELADIDADIEKNELKNAEDKLNALDISKSDFAYISTHRKIQVKKLSVKK